MAACHSESLPDSKLLRQRVAAWWQESFHQGEILSRCFCCERRDLPAFARAPNVMVYHTKLKQLINACLCSRSSHVVVTLMVMIQAASRAMRGAKRLIATFQSVLLVHDQLGSSRRSAGRCVLRVAVRKAWSLPAMGPQQGLPHVHSKPSCM